MLLTRTAHFASPFGQAVQLYTMAGRETLGRPYNYEVDLLSHDDSLDLSKLLGQMCAVVLEHTDGTVRELTGFATEFALVGEHGNFARYRTTLRPFLWFFGAEPQQPHLPAQERAHHRPGDLDRRRL